jgi:hypothetical protein
VSIVVYYDVLSVGMRQVELGERGGIEGGVLGDHFAVESNSLSSLAGLGYIFRIIPP